MFYAFFVAKTYIHSKGNVFSAQIDKLNLFILKSLSIVLYMNEQSYYGTNSSDFTQCL